jgi:hypothetical protein
MAFMSFVVWLLQFSFMCAVLTSAAKADRDGSVVGMNKFMPCYVSILARVFSKL